MYKVQEGNPSFHFFIQEILHCHGILFHRKNQSQHGTAVGTDNPFSSLLQSQVIEIFQRFLIKNLLVGKGAHGSGPADQVQGLEPDSFLK